MKSTSKQPGSSVDWREQRRLRVLELYQKGWPQKTIAEALGITKGYVSQLVKRVKDLPQDERAGALKIVNRAGPASCYNRRALRKESSTSYEDLAGRERRPRTRAGVEARAISAAA